MEAWANHWTRAVSIAEEECHRLNPEIEVLSWEYNIDFRPHRVELKRQITSMMPRGAIPMLTWENGKSFEIDGLHGYLRDYSISQVGPAEVAAAQIAEAKHQGKQGVEDRARLGSLLTPQESVTTQTAAVEAFSQLGGAR